jgi:DNA-binding MurR/RpiR family transcriptional regulator
MLEAEMANDPHTRSNSTRKLKSTLQISRSSVMRLLKKKGYRPWKDQERQFLSEKTKEKRRVRCRKLLERFPNESWKDILFTDEKLFTVSQSDLPCFLLLSD